MPGNEGFEIRDMRDGHFLWADKTAFKYVNRHAGPSGAVVYMWICYYANTKSQNSWPKISTIIADSSLGRMTVIRALKKLEDIRAIDIKRTSGEHNIYTLLEIQPELFNAPVSKRNQSQNGTGTISKGTSTTRDTGNMNNMNKSNNMIKNQPAKPSACGKLPYPEPTEEEVANLNALAASVEKRFNVYMFMQRVANHKGYPPPPAVMISACKEFISKDVRNPWGFFVDKVRRGSGAYFADLNIKEHERLKKEPPIIGHLLRQMAESAV